MSDSLGEINHGKEEDEGGETAHQNQDIQEEDHHEQSEAEGAKGQEKGPKAIDTQEASAAFCAIQTKAVEFKVGPRPMIRSAMSWLVCARRDYPDSCSAQVRAMTAPRLRTAL